jgi:error-prone DNA polymerase
MGFYHPSTIVKDAQRHGLKVLPMDVTKSDWKCTLEPVLSSQFSVLSKGNGGMSGENIAVRLGLKYARGLREPAGQALVRERSLAPFASVQDLARRVPELRKDELTTLAEIGALNAIGGSAQSRRDALWQVERAVRRPGPLLDELPENEGESPLTAMTQEERLVADFHATGLTVGPHPMQYRRAEMKRMGIYSASDLAHLPNGRRLRIGGCVIARQRPGTAKGMMFMSLEDETGIANAIFAPDLLQRNRVLLISERFLMIEGILQNQDNVIHIRAEKVSRAETVSHDFH